MNEDELGVLTANEAFYEAFATRSYAKMDGLWANERPVTCVHPGWSVLIGRAPVMASWRAILRAQNTKIEAAAPRVQLAGDAAYVVCFEGPGGAPPMLIATNIFVREDGHWRLVHHHAGQLASPPEIGTSGPTN